MKDERSLFFRYDRILQDFQDLLHATFRLSRNESDSSVPLGFLDLPEKKERSFSYESREERLLGLQRLTEQIHRCSRCGLAGGRTMAVPGMGVLDPLVLVVGEGPGAEEDKQGLPFVGAAGQFLDKWLESIGLSRKKNVYITNIVKCRPPGNRDPRPEEAESCFPYLEQQVVYIRPKAILTVGRIAAQSLLQTSKGIGTLRESLHRWKDIPLIATYHPSAVLRDPGLKRPVWEDLKRLKAFLHG